MKVCEFVSLGCMAYLVKLNRVGPNIEKKPKTCAIKGKQLKNEHEPIDRFVTFRV